VTLDPFSIRIPPERLDQLAERLRTTVWADEPPAEVGWLYGVPGAALRELVDHWRDGYDWRGVEAAMNRGPTSADRSMA
jgi:hypothetical protein